jgi:hypothetical protein
MEIAAASVNSADVGIVAVIVLCAAFDSTIRKCHIDTARLSVAGVCTAAIPIIAFTVDRRKETSCCRIATILCAIDVVVTLKPVFHQTTLGGITGLGAIAHIIVITDTVVRSMSYNVVLFITQVLGTIDPVF